MKAQLKALLTGMVSVCSVLSFSTNAHAYKMKGIDTRFKLAPDVSGVRLMDHQGIPLDLVNGSYRLRFSNASKSFHIMANRDHRQEFKLPNGFPRGDLKNFQISGDAYRNSVDLIGRTFDQYTGNFNREETRSCTYRCGTREEIERVPEQVCSTDPSTGKTVCETVYRSVVRHVPQYCSGSTTYDVEYVGVDTNFSMKLLDSTNRALLGEFNGTVSSATREVSRRFLHTNCYDHY